MVRGIYFLRKGRGKMQTAFQKCHPGVNMLFFVSVLLYAMVFYHSVLLGISFCASLSYNLYLKNGKGAKTTFAFLIPTLLLVTVFNALFAHYGVTPLFFLPSGNAITLEAMLYGLSTGVMVVTVFLWLGCYNAVVTQDKFLSLFGRRFPTVALLISMTLRFIPMFAKRFRMVEQAQKGIGNETENRWQNVFRNVLVVASWSVENAIETADSMKNRGYGLPGRTSFGLQSWRLRDTVLTVWMALMHSAMIFGIVTGRTKASFNPVIKFPEWTTGTILIFVCFAALCFMPLISDGWEARRWNRLR